MESQKPKRLSRGNGNHRLSDESNSMSRDGTPRSKSSGIRSSGSQPGCDVIPIDHGLSGPRESNGDRSTGKLGPDFLSNRVKDYTKKAQKKHRRKGVPSLLEISNPSGKASPLFQRVFSRSQSSDIRSSAGSRPGSNLDPIDHGLSGPRKSNGDRSTGKLGPDFLSNRVKDYTKKVQKKERKKGVPSLLELSNPPGRASPLFQRVSSPDHLTENNDTSVEHRNSYEDLYVIDQEGQLAKKETKSTLLPTLKGGRQSLINQDLMSDTKPARNITNQHHTAGLADKNKRKKKKSKQTSKVKRDN